MTPERAERAFFSPATSLPRANPGWPCSGKEKTHEMLLAEQAHQMRRRGGCDRALPRERAKLISRLSMVVVVVKTHGRRGAAAEQQKLGPRRKSNGESIVRVQHA